MVDPSVERSTRKYLRLIRDHGIVVRFGVVFGSQITGSIARSQLKFQKGWFGFGLEAIPKLCSVLAAPAIGVMPANDAYACSRAVYLGLEDTVITVRSMDWLIDDNCGRTTARSDAACIKMGGTKHGNEIR